MNIRERISADLNTSLEFIEEALAVSRRHVKKFHIPKRNGGTRVIYGDYILNYPKQGKTPNDNDPQLCQ